MELGNGSVKLDETGKMKNQRHNEPGSREPDVTQFTKNPVNSGRYEKHPTKKKRKKNSANRPTILFNQAKSGYREPLRR